MEDDLLMDLMDSDEKPNLEKVEEEKPKQYNNYNNNNNNGNRSYNNNNGGFKKDGEKKKSLWDREDIKPVKVDLSNFKKTKKTFSVATHGQEAVPLEQYETIIKLAKVLFTKGYCFRYNGDKNNPLALAILNLENSKSEIFLPWKSFNDEFNKPVKAYPSEEAYGIALNNHIKFKEFKPATRAVFSSNIHVMLGAECKEPLDLLLVHNLDGSEVLAQKPDYKKLGNSAFFLKICNECNIPVYNIAKDDCVKRLAEFIKEH